jgi:hypothetical protein
MRRGRLAALAAVALLAACGPRKEPPLASGPPPGLNDRVRVLQGDVLVVDGVNLRLANGYAPQPIPHARCWAEGIAANHATREVKEMVSGAHSIQVHKTARRDEYNRPYAFIGLDGSDLGDALFLAGVVARPVTGTFDWCAPFSQETSGAPPVRALMDFGG